MTKPGQFGREEEEKEENGKDQIPRPWRPETE